MRSLLLATLALSTVTLFAETPDFKIPDSALSATPHVILYGDMRFTDPSNTKVANPTARKLLVDKMVEEHPDAIALSGDVPYAGGNNDDYTQYIAQTAPWRSANLRIYPALGNHEFSHCSESECLNNWWSAFPELKGKRWYSVALGTRIRIYALDTMSSLKPGSLESDWLRSQLTTLPSSVDFVFLTLHHPPVADIQTRIEVDHNPRPNEIALRDTLAELNKSIHARIIVAAGHIHNYERFDLDGVTYLVSGGGGARPYEVDRTPPDLYQSTDFPNFHYIRFVLTQNKLEATMIRLALPDEKSPADAKPEWQPRDHWSIEAKPHTQTQAMKSR
jgi:Icc-related predicted phosphoesterase